MTKLDARYKVFGGIVFGVNVIAFCYFLITKQYPLFLIQIHIASLLLIWGWVLFLKNTIATIRIHKLDMLLCSILFLIALLIRFYQLTSLPPGIYGDEILWGSWGARLIESSRIVPFIGSGFSHPTPWIYIVYFSTEIFGRTVTALRLPSILVGSTSVVLFYILLRQFFKRPIAFTGAFILAGFYPHLVISRFTYEPISSFFFQILAAIFLFKIYKTLNSPLLLGEGGVEVLKKYIVGLGLSLGFGLYTYLNFRSFAAVVFSLGCILFLHKNKKKALRNILLLTIMVFIAAMPLWSHSLLYPTDFWGRTNEIFIFNQNLSADETFKELAWSTLRSLGIFGILGDPSPKHNPAGVPFFDLLTVCFIAAGLFSLYIKNRKLFFVLLILCLPPYIVDVLSLERISEFHYYGIGHPHGMRISGMIGVGLFLCASGMAFLKQWGETKDKYWTNILLASAVGFIFFLHLFWYFNQQGVNPNWYVYNYYVNGAKYLKAADIMNASNAPIIYLSSDYRQSSQIDFFVGDHKKLVVFSPKKEDEAFTSIKSHEFTLVGLSEQNVTILNEIVTRIQKEGLTTRIEVLSDPIGKQEAVIFNN